MSVIIEDILAGQRAAFRAEGFASAETRRDRLTRLSRAVLVSEAELVDALQADFTNRSPFATRAGDILGSVAAIEYHLDNLESWMTAERVPLSPEVEAHGTFAEVQYQPLGVLGAIIPWNGPVLMGCLAAMGGLAAGNRVMLKMSELAPATGEAFARAISRYFDRSELAVINGDATVAAAFSSQPFDHLLFTGSTATGRKVMRAAAENLVPVTLELGGKSPVIIGESADLGAIANRLVAGKLASAGQVCVSPDYVLAPAGKVEALVGECRRAAEEIFPQMMRNSDYTCLIDGRANARMKALLEEARQKGARLDFVPADVTFDDLPAEGRFPFVLVTGVSDDMAVMQEEIFGPVLPIVGYETVDLALERVASGEHPLSAYYFGEDEAEAARVAAAIQTGSVVINDVRCQLVYEALPFGGVGKSGMGRYRGRAGFVTFSNRKTVLHQKAPEAALARGRPPYSSQAHETICQAIALKKAQYELE
ncbi:aldehyde dehydrogenase family protein [Microbaculum marinisediminis]|uniref:Aldehyde dehydrogenase n=1 Tax=Microbaculum marinisediminis TaxID=2931392 RepID=A0AAW5R499_9HYPH|nr:aldehyde dehydrogenase family protein [Microbaculum sp. A6E488]MCT8973703.1 aldehyde dehydrogenase family protein [Microbaculum sp. A6E488]